MTSLFDSLGPAFRAPDVYAALESLAAESEVERGAVFTRPAAWRGRTRSIASIAPAAEDTCDALQRVIDSASEFRQHLVVSPPESMHQAIRSLLVHEVSGSVPEALRAPRPAVEAPAKEVRPRRGRRDWITQLRVRCCATPTETHPRSSGTRD
jgi:hypothetical protein